MPHSWGQLHQGAGRLDVLRMSAPKKKKECLCHAQGIPFGTRQLPLLHELQITPSLKWVFSLFFFFFPIQTENLGKSPKALETTGISSAVPVT